MSGDFVAIVPQLLDVLVIVVLVTDVERGMNWTSIWIFTIFPKEKRKKRDSIENQ